LIYESHYVVYRWHAEAMSFERNVWIRHEKDEPVTEEMVLAAVERERGEFTEGKYRAIPRGTWVDFTVQSQVMAA
jgi:hypothetical protein